jgi:hypothetical protein
MHVFHMVLAGRRDFAKDGHVARQPIDVAHAEVDFAFLRGRQEMQHGVGGAAHGDVQAHGIFERGFVCNVTGQNASVIVLVVTLRQLDDQASRFAEQLFTLGMRRDQRAVAGQR